jgi:hypothetical protein
MLAEELARKAMDGWEKSTGHNANLLQKRAHQIGIGAAGWKLDGGQEIFRVVQVLAKDSRHGGHLALIGQRQRGWPRDGSLTRLEKNLG